MNDVNTYASCEHAINCKLDGEWCVSRESRRLVFRAFVRFDQLTNPPMISRVYPYIHAVIHFCERKIRGGGFAWRNYLLRLAYFVSWDEKYLVGSIPQNERCELLARLEVRKYLLRVSTVIFTAWIKLFPYEGEYARKYFSRNFQWKWITCKVRLSGKKNIIFHKRETHKTE